MILMDVDGVLTDGKLYFTSSGDEIKAFDIQDGMGISLARKAGLKTGIITGRSSIMVSRRAEELKYDIVLQGDDNKLGQYEKIKSQFNLTDQQICYIGDDIPDIPVLQKVGFSVAVANARDELKQFCHYITKRDGGHSAVREVIDKILLVQGKIINKQLLH